VRRDTLGALARHYSESGAPKGEIVLVIGPPLPDQTVFDVDAGLESALKTMGVKEAANAVAAASGRPKREIYARALALSGRAPEKP
jgi:16S rRNA (cytidine1402-2'-O)-methyltransferase